MNNGENIHIIFFIYYNFRSEWGKLYFRIQDSWPRTDSVICWQCSIVLCCTLGKDCYSQPLLLEVRSAVEVTFYSYCSEEDRCAFSISAVLQLIKHQHQLCSRRNPACLVEMWILKGRKNKGHQCSKRDEESIHSERREGESLSQNIIKGQSVAQSQTELGDRLRPRMVRVM